MKVFLNQLLIKPYFILLCFVVIALISYFPTLQIGYISDDWGFVYQLEHYGWQAFLQNFTDKFFIPVSHVIGTIQYYITGGNPIIQHIIQVIIHAIVSWQIFLLFRDISIKKSKKELVQVGIVAGILFLINPFNVESVAWLASKSYGYTLFLSLLALRILLKEEQSTKNYILFFSFTFIAIHCKEWAYMLPFIAICIVRILQIKIKPSFYIGVFLTIGISLALRYIALGSVIGGYENAQSLNLGVVIIHSIAYVIKFLSFWRFSGGESFSLIVPGTFVLVFLIFLIKYVLINKTSKLEMRPLLFFLCIILFSLLPIAGLEMSSFDTSQSDRYSYFALVPFSIIYAFVILYFKTYMRYFTLTLFVFLFIAFSFKYVTLWKHASEVQYTFLEKLHDNVNTNERVLLYNVPDTYQNIYCMRNGIEPFLKVHGKIVDIEVFQRQDFLMKNGGILRINDSIFNPTHAKNTYTTFPKGTITENRIQFDYTWLKEFNKTLIYSNETFTTLK